MYKDTNTTHTKYNKLLAALLLVIASFVCINLGKRTHVFAATFNVNTTSDTSDASAGDGACADGGGDCSLRAAIEEADMLAGADTINVPNGTYTLTSNLPFITQASDLSIIGASATNTIIDGDNSYAAFTYGPNSATTLVTIKNFTIKKTAPYSSFWTGAVAGVDANIDIENLILDQNIGYGIYDGAAILANSYTATIKNILIKGAQNWNGLGIGLGGGISIGFDGPLINTDIQNVSIVNNTVDNFIGIFGAKNTAGTVQNVTIADNSSTGDMDGIVMTQQSQELTFQNITIADNISTGPGLLLGGGGGGIWAGAYATTINLKNVLLKNNKLNNTAANCDASMVIDDFGGNLSNDTTCTSQFTEPSDQNNVDPLLDSLTSADSFNWVLPLLTGSPAIDAGVSSGAPNVDQRGVSRPQGSGIDAGAYEYESGSPGGGNNGGSNSDGDNISDTVEQVAPNNGDGNNDGTPDSQQSNVTSLPSSTTGVYVTVVAPNGTTLQNVSAVDPSSLPKKDTLAYPYGLVNFTVTGVSNGGSAAVELIVHTDQKANDFTARKYHTNQQQYSTISGATLTDFTVGSGHAVKAAYTLTDGGNNDQDGTANGTIVDPAGLATDRLANTGTDTVLLMVIALGAVFVGAALMRQPWFVKVKFIAKSHRS